MENSYEHSYREKAFHMWNLFLRFLPKYQFEGPDEETHQGKTIPLWHLYSLTRHLETHKANYHYKCGTCQVTFRSQSGLWCHRRVHAGIKPHKCETCPSAFTHKRSLTIHMRSHTGEKPYKCELCPSAYSQKPHLTQNMKTHTGDMPHKCVFCPGAFYSKRDLKIHTRTQGRKIFPMRNLSLSFRPK